jgi:hypothetical protein
MEHMKQTLYDKVVGILKKSQLSSFSIGWCFWSLYFVWHCMMVEIVV